MCNGNDLVKEKVDASSEKVEIITGTKPLRRQKGVELIAQGNG